MVSATDLKIYKTLNNLGGLITNTQVVAATPNNLFTNVPKNELVIGEDYYACVYFKNTHPTEAMDNFSLWLTNKSFPNDTEIKWAVDEGTGSTTYDILFDGTNDYVDLGAETTLWSKALTKFSFSLWFKPTATYDIAYRNIVAIGDANDEITVSYSQTEASLILNITNDGYITDSTCVSGSANTVNQWHHLACIYDSTLVSNNLKLYINNSLVDQSTSYASQTITIAAAAKMLLGKYELEAGNTFKGNMKDFRFWTGTAITQTDVNNVYANSPSAPTPSYNLPMTEGTGSPTDTISGTKVGTLTDGASWQSHTSSAATQTIANKYTSPSVTWKSIGTKVDFGQFTAGETLPIWLWLHVNANAEQRADDNATFAFDIDIPQGGTGTGGGSTPPGNPDPNVLNLDQFGLNQLYPTKSGGRTWFSTAWSNGNARSVTENNYDADDPQLGIDKPIPLEIDGNGIATFHAFRSDHRAFVHGPWTNTEMTVLIKVDTSCSSIQLRSRSNHHGVDDDPYGLQSSSPDISCGFGGYETNYDPDDQDVWQEVEVIHDCYQRTLDPHPYSVPPNGIWAGYKQITRSIGTDSVKVQGWFNRDITNQRDWVLISEFTYDGTNVAPDQTSPNVTNCLSLGDSISGDLVANSKWLNPGYWCWLRLNNAENINLQKWSIREIDPASGTGGTGGTGGNPPPVNTDYKIAVSGDWGCETATNNVINLIQDQGYDHVVGVGDNAYESAGCWTTRFTPLKPIFNSAYGNHEYSETGGVSPYKTFFGHNLTYFTYKFQNIFFIVMDDNDFESGSAPSDSVGSTQYNFIVSELNRVANDNTITWKIAVAHHPWFGKNSQHPASEGGQVGAYHSLFINHGVNFYLHGHNHNLERTHQVSYNPSDPRTPTIVDSSSPYSRTAAGLISVDSGAGGHDSGSSLYTLPDNASYWAYLNRTHTAVWEIVASNNGQTLTCCFRDINGSTYDTFTITA